MSDELRDAWLAEMWKPCREVSRDERAYERELAATRNQAATASADESPRRSKVA